MASKTIIRPIVSLLDILLAQVGGVPVCHVLVVKRFSAISGFYVKLGLALQHAFHFVW